MWWSGCSGGSGGSAGSIQQSQKLGSFQDFLHCASEEREKALVVDFVRTYQPAETTYRHDPFTYQRGDL